MRNAKRAKKWSGFIRINRTGSYASDVQWNPSITATIGTRIFGRFRGVAANQGVQRSHAYLIRL